MDTKEFSGSLIVENREILLIKNQDKDFWNVPMAQGERGELSADTAKRATKEHTGSKCVVKRYKKRMKTEIELEGQEVTWHPYVVELENKPQKGEWTPISDLEEKELSPMLEQAREELKKKI